LIVFGDKVGDLYLKLDFIT